ncbi:hypothetical protein BDR05DRAFT_962272 [Suillus weaverae]|nr:hypothetical protein BDR05DRAFT_962272 [Suillus weaverae]
MTLVSNDPSWWPTISSFSIFSYFVVASSAALVYDWALTFGQEIELIWKRRWSLVTVLYLNLRYIGIINAALILLPNLPSILLTDTCCDAMDALQNWLNFVVNAMLGVIMIHRLHVMYRRSRGILISLTVIVLAVTIACGVVTAKANNYITAEALILSGTYQCIYNYGGDAQILISTNWILYTTWEVLALCLAVWIAVKHFRELQQSSRGWTIRDCFTVLMQAHIVYFASFTAVSCFELGYLSPQLSNSSSMGSQIYGGALEIFQLVQMFVLGPRLILSIREYHDKLVANSDAGISMTTMDFQEHVHMSIGSDMFTGTDLSKAGSDV